VTATRTLNYTSRRRSSWAGDAAGSPLLENKAHRGPLFGKLCRFSLSDVHERSSKASQRKNLHRGGALSFTSRGGRVLLICGPLPNEAVRLIGQLKLLHPRPKGDVLHNRRDVTHPTRVLECLRDRPGFAHPWRHGRDYQGRRGFYHNSVKPPISPEQGLGPIPHFNSNVALTMRSEREGSLAHRRSGSVHASHSQRSRSAQPSVVRSSTPREVWPPNRSIDVRNQ
jgi:hypothetical protein